MNTSAFDPAAFLDATQTEVNERRPLLPVENPADTAGFYVAQVGEITTASGVVGKGANTGRPWLSMVVPLKLEVPQQLQDALKLPPTLTLTDRAFVDLTPENSIDNAPGRNRAQKMYREATGLNNPGEAFAWRMLTGRVVKVKVTHEMYNDLPVEKVAGIFRA